MLKVQTVFSFSFPFTPMPVEQRIYVILKFSSERQFPPLQSYLQMSSPLLLDPVL